MRARPSFWFRCCRPIGCAAACAGLHLLAAVGLATPAFDRLYVFGDSYSDLGAGYVDGNGPTAVACLAHEMGLAVTHSRDAKAGDQSIVFACSGARTGAGEGAEVAGGVILHTGMITQVQDFAARVRAGAIKFNPDTTLFFFAGGLNDGPPAEATVANLSHGIEIIRDLGGIHVTLALLPARIPAFAAAGLRLNPAFEKLVPELKQRLSLDLRLSHWGGFFDEVLDHPSAYGLANTTEACAGRALFGEDPTPRGNPDTYFYYHAGHPSAAVHRIVGKKLYQELTSAASLPNPTTP